MSGMIPRFGAINKITLDALKNPKTGEVDERAQTMFNQLNNELNRSLLVQHMLETTPDSLSLEVERKIIPGVNGQETDSILVNVNKDGFMGFGLMLYEKNPMAGLKEMVCEALARYKNVDMKALMARFSRPEQEQ